MAAVPPAVAALGQHARFPVAFNLVIDNGNDEVRFCVPGDLPDHKIETIQRNFQRKTGGRVVVYRDMDVDKICFSNNPPAIHAANAARYQIIADCPAPVSAQGTENDTTHGTDDGTNVAEAKKRRVQKKKKHAVPRPRNAWILYRTYHSKKIRETEPNLTAANIFSQLWKNEPVHEKQRWQRAAVTEAERHRQNFPDYKYSPSR